MCVPIPSPPDYIGEFELIDDHRAGKIVVELNGRLNKCGVVSPRFDIKVHDMEKWIVNLLPSRLVRCPPPCCLSAAQTLHFVCSYTLL